MIDSVIFNTVDNGIVILDKELNILAWNNWLELFTKKYEEEVIGKNFCELFTYVDKKRLQRKIKSVLITKNPSFYSIDPHHFLIEIPLNNIINTTFTSMQQSVTIVPYDIEKEQVCIYIYNHTSLCETNAKLKKLNKELEDMSHRDPLTHLYNRRYFKEESEKIKSLAKRNNQNIAIIVLDIDKFKNINDTYGHLIGDYVIKKVASELKKAVRSSDVVARFGGEEFVVLLQNSNSLAGFDVAEKIRIRLEESKIITKNKDIIKFTASFGIAQFDLELDSDNIEHTITRADYALYEAKDKGRNKSILAKV